jgi:hypothetical protein
VLFKGVLTNTNLVLKGLVLHKGLGKSTKPLFNLKLKPDLIVLMHNQPQSDYELLSLKVPTVSFLNFNKFYDYKTGLPNNKANLYLLFFVISIIKKRSEILKTKKIRSKVKVQRSALENHKHKKERSTTTPGSKNKQKRAIKKFLSYF